MQQRDDKIHGRRKCTSRKQKNGDWSSCVKNRMGKYSNERAGVQDDRSRCTKSHRPIKLACTTTKRMHSCKGPKLVQHKSADGADMQDTKHLLRPSQLALRFVLDSEGKCTTLQHARWNRGGEGSRSVPFSSSCSRLKKQKTRKKGSSGGLASSEEV